MQSPFIQIDIKNFLIIKVKCVTASLRGEKQFKFKINHVLFIADVADNSWIL